MRPGQKSHIHVFSRVEAYVVILLTQNFICENFIFANSVKRHICDVKNSRLRHDLLTSRNDIMVSPLREDFIFTFAKIKTIAKFPKYTKSEKGDLKVDTLHPNGNMETAWKISTPELSWIKRDYNTYSVRSVTFVLFCQPRVTVTSCFVYNC